MIYEFVLKGRTSFWIVGKQVMITNGEKSSPRVTIAAGIIYNIIHLTPFGIILYNC